MRVARSCPHIRRNEAQVGLAPCHVPVHDPSHGMWAGFGALAGMSHQHNGHPGVFPCPWCAGFQWSPDQDPGVLVYEGRRLVEDNALLRRLMVR